MTFSEFLSSVAGLSGVLLLVSSMLAMGMSLSSTQILEPLKNTCLVILALLVLLPTAKQMGACSQASAGNGTN